MHTNPKAVTAKPLSITFAGDPRNMNEAISRAERALSVVAESARGHGALATALAATGRNSKARVSFERAIQLDPNDAAAMGNFSLLEVQLAHLEESLRLARQSLERNPNSSPAYSHVAMTLELLGTEAQFRQWAEFWLERGPRSLRQFTTYEAVAGLREGRTQKVLSDARAMSEKYRGAIELEALVTDLSMITGEPDAEAQLLRFATGNLDPAYMNFMILPESPRVRLAWFHQKRGDRAGAAKLLTEAEGIAMGHWRDGLEAPSLPVELAAIHAMKGDAGESAAWMRRAYDLGWREPIQDKVDPMLAGAGNDPRFQAVVKMIKDDLERQRRESRELKLLFEQTVPALPPPRAAAKN